MKKSFILLSLLSILFVSCASVPKAVKPGDTLVIGNLSCIMLGYKNYEDVNLNGTIKEGVELTIMDLKKYSDVKTVKTDKNGFFVITGLTPHESYCISKIKISKTGNSGASLTTGLEFTPENRHGFVAYDNAVVNIGTTTYTFNGRDNWVNWSFDEYWEAERMFKQEAAESEWLTKQIYQQ